MLHGRIDISHGFYLLNSVKENRVVGNWEWTVPKVTYINFLLNNISIHTGHREKREIALIFYLILSPSFLRNVWRSVRIICMWILVLKGLSRHFFSGQAGNLALKKPEGLNWAELTFTNTSWIAEKTADISMATLPLVSPPNNVWETSAEVPYWWRDLGSASDWPCHGKVDSTNQKHYPDLGSDASSVWDLCRRFSDTIWRGNQW